MSYLVKAIQKLHPEAEFSLENDDYSTITWDILEGSAPTQSEIDSAIKLVKAEEEAALATKEALRKALLDRLGISESEAQLLLS